MEIELKNKELVEFAAQVKVAMCSDWIIEQMAHTLTYKASMGLTVLSVTITEDDLVAGIDATVDAIKAQIEQYMSGKLNVVLNKENRMPAGIGRIIKGMDIRQRSSKAVHRANERASAKGER